MELTSTNENVRFYHCIESCFESANSSWICADACLNDATPTPFRDCISLCLFNAEVCAATARMLTKAEVYPYTDTLRQLKACMEVSQLLREECLKFGGELQCCLIAARCAEECQRICMNCMEELVIT